MYLAKNFIACFLFILKTSQFRVVQWIGAHFYGHNNGCRLKVASGIGRDPTRNPGQLPFANMRLLVLGVRLLLRLLLSLHGRQLSLKLLPRHCTLRGLLYGQSLKLRL